jgi:hypothetical protein
VLNGLICSFSLFYLHTSSPRALIPCTRTPFMYIFIYYIYLLPINILYTLNVHNTFITQTYIYIYLIDAYTLQSSPTTSSHSPYNIFYSYESNGPEILRRRLQLLPVWLLCIGTYARVMGTGHILHGAPPLPSAVLLHYSPIC